jgi:hypothetical protein
VKPLAAPLRQRRGTRLETKPTQFMAVRSPIGPDRFQAHDVPRLRVTITLPHLAVFHSEVDDFGQLEEQRLVSILSPGDLNCASSPVEPQRRCGA